MKNLNIKETKYTPKIDLDISGSISLIGKSYPENTFEFYAPMMDWIKEYFSQNSSDSLIVNIEITYLNSSSAKLFFYFFDLLEENKDNNKIEINWIFDKENESAKEVAEDFIEEFEELKINLIIK